MEFARHEKCPLPQHEISVKELLYLCYFIRCQSNMGCNCGSGEGKKNTKKIPQTIICWCMNSRYKDKPSSRRDKAGFPATAACQLAVENVVNLSNSTAGNAKSFSPCGLNTEGVGLQEVQQVKGSHYLYRLTNCFPSERAPECKSKIDAWERKKSLRRFYHYLANFNNCPVGFHLPYPPKY